MSADKEIKTNKEKVASGSKGGGTLDFPFGFKRQPIRGGRKPGRNWACPCGSGLKYKDCCLKKEQQDLKRQQIIAEYQSQAQEFVDRYDKKKSFEKPEEEKNSISSRAAKSRSTERVELDWDQ